MPKGKPIIRLIEEKEGKLFIDIIKELRNKGSRNCDIARKYGIAQSAINQYLNKVEKTGSPESYGRVRSINYKFFNKEKISRIELQYKMTFPDVLKYLRYEKKCNCDEIAELLDSTVCTIQDQMKKFGIQMNHSDAIKQAAETGRQDYGEIHKTIRDGSLRMLAKGSSKEEYMRAILKSLLDEMLPDKYIFLIAFTDWSILKDREIDIPIIIIDNEQNKVYKFAIEYDGAKFHTTVINNEKSIKLYEQGWQYYNIYDNGLSDGDLNNIAKTYTQNMLLTIGV